LRWGEGEGKCQWKGKGKGKWGKGFGCFAGSPWLSCSAGPAGGRPWFAQAHASWETSPSVDNDGESAGDCDFSPDWTSADSVFQLLPVAAQAAQSDFIRSALSHFGIERRRHCVEIGCKLVQHLELVPEAAGLRPRVEAFIDGSDPDHFGEVVADLLAAWATSGSPEQVNDAVVCLKPLFRKAFCTLRWGEGEGKCQWKGKGKGKWGKGFGCFAGSPWLSCSAGPAGGHPWFAQAHASRETSPSVDKVGESAGDCDFSPDWTPADSVFQSQG